MVLVLKAVLIMELLADTKAAHLLGGFKECMSFAYRICRSCMITKDEVQSRFTESDCVLRMPKEHFEECRKLTGLSNDPCFINTGINRLSILEEITEFSVVNGLPHDIMHDIFEGVANYELEYFLCCCLEEKLLPLQNLINV